MGVKHSTGMSNMVFKMLNNGWADKDVCNQLGMEAEELLLKHIKASKLFANAEYNKAWVTKNQILWKKQQEELEKVGKTDINEYVMVNKLTQSLRMIRDEFVHG